MDLLQNSIIIRTQWAIPSGVIGYDWCQVSKIPDGFKIFQFDKLLFLLLLLKFLGTPENLYLGGLK